MPSSTSSSSSSSSISEPRFKSIQSSSLIERHRVLDAWFPFRYSMNTHSGCFGSCLYCPVNFSQSSSSSSSKTIWFKQNLLGLLKKDLAKLEEKLQFPHKTSIATPNIANKSLSSNNNNSSSLIGIGGGYNDFFDPKVSVSAKMQENILSSIIQAGHKALVLTKWPSAALRHTHTLLDTARKIHNSDSLAYAKLQDHLPIIITSFSSLQNKLAKAVEANIPSIHERLKGIHELKSQGYSVGAALMPFLALHRPFNQAFKEDALHALKNLQKAGVSFLLFSTLKTRPHEALGQQVPWLKKDSPIIAAPQNMQYLYALAEKMKLPTFLPRSLFQQHLSLKDCLAILFAQAYQRLVFSAAAPDSKAVAQKKISFQLAAYRLSLMDEPDFHLNLKKRSFSDIKGFHPIVCKMIEQAAFQSSFQGFEEIL